MNIIKSNYLFRSPINLLLKFKLCLDLLPLNNACNLITATVKNVAIKIAEFVVYNLVM